MSAHRKTNGIGEAGRNLAANLRRFRDGQGISTTALSTLLTDQGRGISATGITKIEGLARKVDVDDLVALAYVLAVSPIDLLSPAPVCPRCEGSPPTGFSCRTCGADG